DNKHSIRQTAHVLDTTDGALKLLHVTGAHQSFFFGQLGESTVLALCSQVTQATNRRTNGFVVGQHTTQPTVTYERLTSALGLLFDSFLCCTLGAHKQNFFLLG